VATDEDRLEQLAAEILDGRAVDWSAAESDSDAAELRLLHHLKVVAAVADVHRIPDSWGHLRLIERIGSGTFGDVYRAWDPRIDREVALKLLPADRPSDDRNASSIIHEGRLLARVHHTNIVTIHGAEQIGDRIGLWMELVRGRTLEEILVQEQRFTTGEVARIGVDLCSAVEAVHASGLIHRDVKASNVMLAEDGRVVLMDFGTGRELDDRSVSDLTGTPLYVAPEVLGGRPATAQSDVYSLGVLLFHALTGSYPVQGHSLAEIRAAHDTNSRSSLRAIRPDAPSRLSRAIERAVDPVPDRRHQSAAEFGAALRAAANGLARRRILFRVLAAAALVAAAGLTLRERGPGTSREMPAIAVLPFENRDTAPGSGEFADGLTDEIQRNLAVIEGLALRSTGSSFSFRDKPRNLREVGSQLGVDFVLEGSVSRANNALQIDTRFTRVSDTAVIWTNRFERDVKALPAVLDEISLAIVNQLRVTLGRGQRRYDLDPDLYYQFLRARAFHGMRGPENSARAAELFQQVVSRAPEYAPAWAGLASALAQLSRPSTGEDIIPPDPRLGPAALKALQLDPLLAEGHAALASMYARDRDWVNARMSFLKALALNPSLTETHNDFVLGVLMPVGDTDEALRQLAAARVADPLSLDVRRTEAHMFVEAGRYQDAIDNCQWIKRHDPAFPFVDVWLGRALYLSGRYDEARRALERAGPQFWGYLGYLLAVSGRREEAEALAAKHPEAPSRTMLIYAGLGDRDRAYEALSRTADINWWRAATWLHRPEMALLRGDPRLPALRKKLGLPEGELRSSSAP
jgi:serine/threonine-protein kinase